jgi:hypothetical protein
VLLARKGHNVLGVDRAQFPSDTVSTHFMWPRTTAFLAKWGLLDKLSHSRRVDLHLGGTLTRRMGAGRSHDEWDKYRKDVEGNYLDIIGLAPSLAERLKCSEQVTSFKGASKLLNFYRQSFGKGWALKVRAFFVVGATVVVHGRRGLSCYRLAHACSRTRQLREPAGGGPRVSPSLYQEYGRAS